MKSYGAYNNSTCGGSGYYHDYGNGYCYNSFSAYSLEGYGCGKYSVGGCGNGMREGFSSTRSGYGRGDGIGFYPREQMSI